MPTKKKTTRRSNDEVLQHARTAEPDDFAHVILPESVWEASKAVVVAEGIALKEVDRLLRPERSVEENVALDEELRNVFRTYDATVQLNAPGSPIHDMAWQSAIRLASMLAVEALYLGDIDGRLRLRCKQNIRDARRYAMFSISRAV